MTKEENTIELNDASESFNRAWHKAVRSRIQNIINSKHDDLLSFYEVKDIIKPRNQVYLGIQTVPVRLIVGSEGRYRDFNRDFLPRSEFLRPRWERVHNAQAKDIPLPAVELYEIGGAYFVRDGNHRVSVAKSQGVEEIDAEVTSLGSEITITSSMTTDDLRQAVINLEKKIFYEKTNFLEITGEKDLSFTAPGCYDKIFEHILDHKYFLNQEITNEISFPDACASWYREIYQPIITIINKEKIPGNFPGKSPSDLYIWIVRYWDFLKRKKGPGYSARDAARNFSHRYGSRESENLFTFIKSLIEKIRSSGVFGKGL